MTLADGRALKSDALAAARGPERPATRGTTTRLTAEDGALAITWRRWVRPGSPYLQQELTLEARGKPVPISSVTFFDLPAAGVTVAGSVDGSPLVRDRLFFAVEHPLAKAAVEDGRAHITLPRPSPLRAGQSDTIRSVIGVAPARDQLRRVFAAYVEERRARRHRPFLQYNSWFDLSWANRSLTAAECLQVIKEIGPPLRARGVTLDAFVFDDGWDDPGTLWEIDRTNFPDGFAPLAAAARRLGSGVGVWMSPWGGYDPGKARRLEAARRAGFRVTADGLSLADPEYFARFRATAASFVTGDRVRYLKLDGVTARQLDETEALFRLIAQLRASSPALFVNVTVGTWPSPFWLWHADSIWRGGEDLGFTGEGDKREQWLTFRDAQVHRNVVVAAPLFPLSALMTHGLVNGQHGPGAAMAAGGPSWQHDIRAYFGSGVALQELYVTPSRLQSDDWDALAEGARWARDRAPLLADSHWVGGDPAAGGIYGWAAFAPSSTKTKAVRPDGVLVLRNPRDRPGSIDLDLGDVFQLPPSARRRYTLTSPWKQDAPAPITVEAGAAHSFSLAPFEVRVLEARATR